MLAKSRVARLFPPRDLPLENIVNFHLRKIITKFRCSDHKLEIEIGRYNRIPRENKLCKACVNVIEDEMRFLCSCPSYNNVRAHHFGTETLNK